jgi:excisionase family DNA binding protein
MPTAEKVIKDIYLLPMKEREKIARHIIEFGIKGAHHDLPEILDVKEWQDEIASKPFNLKQASEYLGVSSVTLRRWIKTGRVSAYKIGRAYTFEVMDLKRFKKKHLTKNLQKDYEYRPESMFPRSLFFQL